MTDRPRDGRPQLRQAGPCCRARHDQVGGSRCVSIGKTTIAFGPDVQSRALGSTRWKRGAGSFGRTAIEQQVGAPGLHRAEGLRLGCNVAFGEVDARGVDQLDAEPIAVEHGREVVAGRPGLGRDDGSFSAEQGVEEPALSHVGGSDQDDAWVACGAVAIGQSAADRAQLGGRSAQFGGQCRAAKGSTSGSSVKSRLASR